MRPDQSQELYDALFDPDVGFGVETGSALYKVGGAGAGVSIAGIFNETPMDVVLGEGAGVTDAQSTFTCWRADLPVGSAGGDSGDTIVIGGVTWRVIDIRPDEANKVVIPLGAVT